MKKSCGFLLVVLVLLNISSGFASQIKRVEEANKPEIWMNSPIKAVMQAERVARADAIRKMVEKLYGVRVSADQTVYDMIKEDSRVKTGIDHILSGMREKKWHYYPEGICQVELEITWREMIKRIEKTISESCDGCGSYLEENVKVTEEAHNKKIVVWGSGAIKDTHGVQEIQALRAAEIDAYRKIAQRIIGVNINSETTVKDMVIESDRIKNCVEGLIKGATLYDYTFEPRKVTVKCKIKKKKLIINLKETIDAEQDIYGNMSVDIEAEMKAKTKIREFVETGVGLISDISEKTECLEDEEITSGSINIVITGNGEIVVD